MKKGFSYFQTTALDKGEHHQRIVKAANQAKVILEFFRQNPDLKLTRLELHDKLIQKGLLSSKTPESSTGRALCNLKDRGKLEKTPELRLARYGAKNHLWKLSENSN